MGNIDGSETRPAAQNKLSGLRLLTAPQDAMRIAIALGALLMAAPVRAEQVIPASFATATYTLRTPVETIAADPAAAAVLNRDLPGLLTDPNYAIFKTMSLKQLQQASGGDLSIVDVNKTLGDLQLLPPRQAAANGN